MTPEQWTALPWDDSRYPRARISTRQAKLVLSAHGLAQTRLPKVGWEVVLLSEDAGTGVSAYRRRRFLSRDARGFYCWCDG